MSETCLCKARGRNESAPLPTDERVTDPQWPRTRSHPCPDRGAGTARDVASDIKRDVTYFSFEDT